MNKPEIGDIWEPVNSTRFGKVMVMSEELDFAGYDGCYHVRFIDSDREDSERFQLIDGVVKFKFVESSNFSLENE